MNRLFQIRLLLFLFCQSGISFGQKQGFYSQEYNFDSTGISRVVLENYLEKAITMVYLLIPDQPEGRRAYNFHSDDVRMVKDIGAKFIGRAIYRWGGESKLNEPEFWNNASGILTDLHAFDPEMVLQGCLFEIVTAEVETVAIPAWVFEAFNLPVDTRSFSYTSMLNDRGIFVDHWGKDKSVPDISQLETQLWFYFLASAYMEIGVEAFHLGQVELIGMNDPDHAHWEAVIRKIRHKATTHARRGWVILDAHTPKGEFKRNGVSLIDFNSFPLRVKEVVDKPLKGILEVGHLDALYLKSQGAVTPSGWICESLPYLVEFDNFGRSPSPNVADTSSHFVWGWDEISWFALQQESERNDWLKYAFRWLHETDSNGHLQMPGTRMISNPNATEGNYRANSKSMDCPIGYGQENTIKELWSLK